MKFLDKQTKNILDTGNELTIAQYKKYKDRYEITDDNESSETFKSEQNVEGNLNKNIDFNNMADEELTKYAEEKKIDISKAKTRDAVIKLLK